MAYVLQYSVSVRWQGDGVGPFLSGAQVLTLGNQGVTQTADAAVAPNPLNSGFQGAQPVPGGDSPTGGNFGTAAVAAGADISAALQTTEVLAIIQGFATGGS